MSLNFHPIFVQSLPPKFSGNPQILPKFKPAIASRYSLLKFHINNSNFSNGIGEESSSVSNDAVSRMVEELLKKDDNTELLDGLEEASRRVDRARVALADIERQEAEALIAKKYVSQLESRKLEIEESQKEISEARAMVDEARCSLSVNMTKNSSEGAIGEEIDKDIERLESVKAACISAVIGTLASLPFSLHQDMNYSDLFLQLAIIFGSCALFGVTFRYIMRRDLDDVQLKTGASAAFGFVRGLAILGVGEPLRFDLSSFISHSVDGAIYISESVFIFLSASIALDLCFKMRLLSPFPVKKVKKTGYYL